MDREIIKLCSNADLKGLSGNGLNGNGISVNDNELSINDIEFEKLIKDLV